MLEKLLTCQSARFVLADFNASVLRLCTLPNVLLNWASCKGYLDGDQGELEITGQLLTEFQENNDIIVFDFISGPWGTSFLERIQESLSQPFVVMSKSYGPDNLGNNFLAPRSYLEPHGCQTVVLASESIYSPSSTATFAKVFKHLCSLAKERGKYTALIAAKRIYFGVGGGIDEFISCLWKEGGNAETLWEEDQGVGRVILNVF